MTDEDKELEDLPTPRPLPTRGAGCTIDKMCGKYGPYRYHVTKHKGKQHWKYLGKTSKFTGLVKKEDE